MNLIFVFAKAVLPLIMLTASHASAAWFPPAAAQPARDLLPLLGQLCPGQAFANENAIGCRVCPEGTDFASSKHDFLSATGVTVGHFLSPVAQALAISTAGCESHANGWAGTALFEKRGGAWKLVRYRSGVITNACHIFIKTDRRDALLCERSDGHQGEQWAALVMMDLSDFNSKGVTVFNMFDTMATCSASAHAGAIERVRFGAPNGIRAAAVSVWATYGVRPYSKAQVAACNRGVPLPTPQIRHYRLDYTWNGAEFGEAPWNPKTPAKLQDSE